MEVENVSIRDGVYYRHTKGNVKNMGIEFVKKIKEITEDSFYDNKQNFEPTYITFNNSICICGKNNCNQTYILKHTPSDKSIAVGSRCIDKAFDGFLNNTKLLEKNGRCKNCTTIIIRGGKNKNTDKGTDICINCNKLNEKKCLDRDCVLRDTRSFITRCVSCYYEYRNFY